MHLVRFLDDQGRPDFGCSADGQSLQPLGQVARGRYARLSDLLEETDPHEVVRELIAASDPGEAFPLAAARLLPPIDQQEVWAAGVTYIRSKAARMEESEAAASCYDRVYVSDRPELFMKATPHRVVGPGQPVRIRRDSHWNVPEPELTLVANSRLELVGFTIGDDVSSRDIEGENPLYLPQAKVYNGCCALGPWITLPQAMPPRDQIGIHLAVQRDGQVVFGDSTGVHQMARSFENLLGWLGRDNSFPQGVFLLTGTGIVPDSTFTLQPGDQIDISIDGIGTLSCPVVQGDGDDRTQDPS